MIGVNDPWTRPVDDPADASAVTAWSLDRVLDHSRSYALAYMLVQSFRLRNHAATERASLGGQVQIDDHTFDLSFQRKTSEEAENSTDEMQANLRETVRRAREAETTLVLMTYPAALRKGEWYRYASRVVRRVAHETGTPLIDLWRVFAELCPDPACEELLFADGHATAEGYRVIAGEVARELRALS